MPRQSKKNEFIVHDAPHPKRFLVMCAPRTGSNYLCSLLNSHRNILCHHELYNPKGIHYALGEDQVSLANWNALTRDNEPAAFLGEIWRRYKTQHRALGFKLGWDHPQAVFDLVYSTSSISVILLSRRNRLKMYVSEQIAQKEGRWTHYEVKSSETESLKIHIDMDDMLTYIRKVESYYDLQARRLASSGQTCLALSYEDLFDETVETTLLEFLKIEPIPGLQAATVKRNSSDLKCVVSNYSEIERQLINTDFEQFLMDTGL